MAVFVTYFALGLTLSSIVGKAHKHSDLARLIIYAVTGLLALAAAGLSFRDGLRARAGKVADLTISLPDWIQKRIRLTISRRTRMGLTVGTTLALGGVVALFELPCTGQVYVLVIAALPDLPNRFWGSVGWLLIYNLCFIMPLVAVFIGVLFGLTSQRLTPFFRRHIAKTKFAMAVLFAGLCAYMVVQAVPAVARLLNARF